MARTTAGNLTAAVTSFVGRRREIGQVRAFLGASRLVTLTGVGGVGKTRLAVAAAGEAQRAFPGGVWFADLAAVTDGEQVAPTVATALAIRDQSTRPALERLVEQLAGRPALIVLDNCEHVLDASAVLVDAVLRGAPEVRILVTSRQSLGIDGEQVFAVPPLSVPPQDSPLPALHRFEAVALLVERAAAVAPGFAVDEDNRDAVVRLCARLDGIPLAIELAATRLRTLSIGQLLRRLEDRFAVLNIGSRVAAPRQRTLRALVDWSYDLATSEERLLWARLSIFSGGFDLDAAEAVCACDGIARDRILDLLDQLVTRSVVARRGDTRLGMLETIREYGLARLAESGGRDTLRLRHRAYFLEFAERAARDWCGPGQEETLARIRADHGNLRAAFEHFAGDPSDPACAEAAQALAAALHWHWCADGLLSESRGWLDRALAMPSAPGPARANALWVGAWVALLQGDQDVARGRLDECRRVAAAIGDPVPAAHAASQAGTAELFRGDPGAAVAHFREAIPALDAAGETAGAMHTGFQLAIALSHRGEHDEAAATAGHAIDVSEAHGEHLNRSYALWALATCTRSSRPNGTWLFATHPDQWAAVRADPALIASAINETLRLESPIQCFSRVVTRDVDLGDGVLIPEGARVMVSYGSANRDERHFPDPDTFDVTRNPADHLSFSYGIHACAGQGLAWLEATAIFTALAARVERIELAGEPERALNNITRGFARLPVRAYG